MNAGEFFLITTVVSLGGAIAFAVAWWREHYMRFELQRQVDELELRSVSLERLQSSIESIAMEVGRVAEIEQLAAQRLALREHESESARRPLPSAERVVTPH